MGFKLPPTRVLPGGRKVRDYDHLTVEYQEEQKQKRADREGTPSSAISDEDAVADLEGKPRPSKSKPAKADKDESLG